MNNNYDSDEEQVEEVLPPYKIRYNEMPQKQLKEVVKSIEYNSLIFKFSISLSRNSLKNCPT